MTCGRALLARLSKRTHNGYNRCTGARFADIVKRRTGDVMTSSVVLDNERIDQ